VSAVPAIDLALLRTWPLPRPGGESDKNSRGRVLAVAGGAGSPGAAILTGVAALRAGAGKLQIAAPAGVAAPLAIAMPEARVLGVAETAAGDISAAAAEDIVELAGRCDAVVAGPGQADEAAAAAIALRLLASDGPAVLLDAAAMTGLTRDARRVRRASNRLVVTPHAGEMAKLLGVDVAAIRADPLTGGRRAAAALQAVVVMKGAETFVISPDGAAWRHAFGVPGLGVSGSGDVLAGIIAGLLARGAAPVQAAAWAVFVHAQAGLRLSRRIAPLGFLAREILDEVAPVLGVLEGQSAAGPPADAV
jgi:ADP-dependent NAD(P)H-hydrate dehydratase